MQRYRAATASVALSTCLEIRAGHALSEEIDQTYGVAWRKRDSDPVYFYISSVACSCRDGRKRTLHMFRRATVLYACITTSSDSVQATVRLCWAMYEKMTSCASSSPVIVGIPTNVVHRIPLIWVEVDHTMRGTGYVVLTLKRC